jgi:tetratricopeptide (TPR) repeat protein
MGDPIAAMSDFEKAIQVAPFSPEAHVEMGDLFFARKDYGRAILHYTDAIERDPNHPMALCRRGICYHYRQRPENALDDLKAARLVAPDIPNIDRYVRMVSTPQSP